MRLPEPLEQLIDALADLPSIGPRQATRLAFYLIQRGENSMDALARNLDAMKRVKICENCFFVHDRPGRRCSICDDPARNAGIIMIIEKETDLLSIENTGKFAGRYFIMGMIPKTGILEEWQKLRLEHLKKMMMKELGGKSPSSPSGQAEEIIIGFNPTSSGDWNAGLIAKELGPLAAKITRLGRGLPTGGEIEFADDETLGSALERRS